MSISNIDKIREKVEKLKKLADAMYYAAQQLTTDASRLHKAMDEYHQFLIYEYYKEEPTIADIVDEHYWEMLGEEPMSEDFEEALAKEWQGYVDRGAATVDALEDNTQELAFAKGFYRGSKWQKEQDQSTIELAEDHAMLAGMEKMKEEMMAKAKSGTVQKDNQVILDDGTYMDLDPSMQLKPSFVGLKEGDRIKVILIKED